jgi:hypothetical protein
MRVVAQRHRRALAEVLIAPRLQGDQDWHEFSSCGREEVLIPRWALGVWPALKDTHSCECFQSHREHVSGGASCSLDAFEAPDAVGELADDQQ